MTRVALVWHMHQPFYEDLATGEHVLPWVRLHAIKDYWGMVALLREFPTVKATFNLVPSLLVQLESFARNEARDRHLDIGLKPAEALTAEEREFCVTEFFHAHRPRMIDPYPRYAELLLKRESNGVGLSVRSRTAQFSTEDLRDLQVWHKLAWIDPYYFDRDERVRALVAKGRGFTEQDKATLRAVELELLRRVVPEYRDAADRGQIEISTSPFYHPILPLLCDTDVYLRTHPTTRMPRERFRRPEDAAEQLSRAVELHVQLFGKRPIGVWPSEGSVSDAMVPLVAAAGFRWMATDEEILAKTTGREFGRDPDGHVEHPEALYRAYRVGREGQHVACGFRDHALSDLIGFSYASWPAEAAAENFLHRLVDAGSRYASRTNGGDATVFIILDGENAWEHYEGQGRPFLRALYRRLASHPTLQTVTMTEACAMPKDILPTIFPGSWINADFYIWIGHADDQRAWSQLADARRALDGAARVAPDSLARAWDEMLIAEGSDWFWWYGDDHSSEHDLVFDELFRRHVRNIYRAIEQPVPEELFVSNITTRPPAAGIELPSGFIHPEIDGEVTNYFEWIGAGSVEVVPSGDAMQEVSATATVVSSIEFGFDLENLYLKVAGSAPMRDLLRLDQQLTVNFLKPEACRIIVSAEAGSVRAVIIDRQRGGREAPRNCPDIQVAAGRLLELKVPFRCLGVGKDATIAFIVAINRDGAEVEHHPRHRPIELQVPDEKFPARNWTA
jgi:alpha-amylase/alpha-mannosidase (GH57 family)